MLLVVSKNLQNFGLSLDKKNVGPRKEGIPYGHGVHVPGPGWLNLIRDIDADMLQEPERLRR